MVALDAPLSVRIPRKVAAREGVEASELTPLYEAIEPDALEALVSHGFTGKFAFRYEGCRVIVSGNGGVEVREASSDHR